MSWAEMLDLAVRRDEAALHMGRVTRQELNRAGRGAGMEYQLCDAAATVVATP